MRLKTVEFRKMLCRRGCSVAGLAQRAGLQAETVYGNLRYPGRQIRWGTLMRVCQALECEPNEIAVVDEPEGEESGTGGGREVLLLRPFEGERNV